MSLFDRQPGTKIPHSGKSGQERPVDEFDNTTLHEAVEKGLVTTPDSPAPLAPVERKDDGAKKRNKIIAGIASLGLLGGGVVAGMSMGGGEKSTEPRTEPTAAAPVDPGEVEVAQTPDQLIGTPVSDNFDLVNVKPDQSVIDRALEGVSVDEVSNPEEAFAELAKISNIIDVSATIEPNGTEETAASIQLRDQLLNQLYSERALQEGNLETKSNIRAIVGYELYFINDSEAANPNVVGTWSNSYELGSIVENSDGSHTAEATRSIYTNIDTANRYYESRPSLLDLDEARAGVPTQVTMIQENGKWVWDRVTS